MTDYGDGIIERLPDGTGLQDKYNPFHKLLNYGLGGWLDSFDEDNLAEMIFLESATGKWLDVHGEQYGIPRKLDELDEAYRQRIVYESLGEITVPFLVNVYGLTLYCYIEDFDVTENTLTSDNVYACHNYMSFVDENTQAILDKKYVIGSGLTYIEEE